MTLVKEKIKYILENKTITVYQLSKLMDFSEGSLRTMINTKCPFSENAIKKLLPILEISREEFDSWIVADKYSKEIIELAIKAKQEVCHPALDAGSNKQTKYINQSGINITGKILNRVQDDKGRLILTTKLDAILEEKAISRTTLAKQIKYSQSGLNRMIVGKIGLSKSVLEKISKTLEVPQNEITSWIVADSYNLDTLKMACTHK